MCGFEECTSLEELYLSHNGIKELQVQWRRRYAAQQYMDGTTWRSDVCTYAIAAQR